MIIAHEQDHRHGEMLKKIRGAVFFGVPHCGADAARLANLVAVLLRVGQFGLSTNRAYVKALQRNSETLSTISEEFTQRSASLHIRTFFETERIAGQIVRSLCRVSAELLLITLQIVERESAVMNLPLEVAIPLSESSHITMCKFDDQNSQKFKLVRQGIAELAQQCNPVEQPPVYVQTSRTIPIKAGSFGWPNGRRGADRFAALWANPAQREIRFSQPYDEPPRVLVGFKALDFGCQKGLRAYASTANITPIGFRPLLEHWLDSINVRIDGSWLEIAPGNKDFQNGRESTYGLVKAIGRAPGKFVLRRPVKFYRGYDTVPTVICWFTLIDSCGSKNHRLEVKASQVTNSGFSLDFQTWGDSHFFELEAEWLAFSADRRDVYSKGQNMTSYKAQSHTFNEQFDGRFQHAPSCFVALNYIDSDCTKNTRIDISSMKITKDGATIVAGSWSDSVIYQIGFTLLAIA
jgi:H-type lectin domain